MVKIQKSQKRLGNTDINKYNILMTSSVENITYKWTKMVENLCLSCRATTDPVSIT